MTISKIKSRRIFPAFLTCLSVLLAASPVASAAAAPSEQRRSLRIGAVIAGSPLWAEWSQRFLRPSGRVLDTANSASHSEGQGYGMLLAVAAGDRPAFDRMWGWTRANLAVRADNLLAWRWDSRVRAVSDRNNATDGDILVAWALAEAADLWSEPDYAAAGRALAHDISREAVAEVPGVGPVLLPATYGFASSEQPDGPVVNLSYWVFPAFGRLAQLAPERDWDAIRRGGLAVLDAIQSKEPGAVTNWTALADAKAAPAMRFPALSGYDAFRIPLYLAFSTGEHRDRLQRFARTQPVGGQGFPVLNLRSGEAVEFAAGRGYAAIAALRACAVAAEPFPREFYGLGEQDAYYPATLHMLAIIAALTSRSACLDPTEARAMQPLGWTPRVAADLTQVAQPAVAQHVVKPVAVVAAALPGASSRSVEPFAQGDGGAFSLGAFSGAALAFLGFFAVTRLRRRSAPPPPAPAIDRPRSPAPRCLPENPFRAASGAGAVEERLDIAARASRQWQRTAAVAYFRLTDFDAIVAKAGRESALKTMDDLASALSTRLRKSDAVASLAQDEVVVCLSLIADDTDLESVGRRLTVALRVVHPTGDDDDENVFGLALYRASGAECLARARRAFEAMSARQALQPKSAPQAKSAPRRRKPKAKAPVGTSG